MWYVVCGMLGRYALLSPANDDTHDNEQCHFDGELRF